MSGIFLKFKTTGLNPDDLTHFRSHLIETITRIPGEPIEVIEGPLFIGASCHHGALPSGGVASNSDHQMVAWGSSWLHPEDASLAPVAKIFSRFNENSWENRGPLSGLNLVAHTDDQRSELVVESDRFGASPLYYREIQDGIQISSEIKFLIEPGQDNLDMESLVEMFGMGFLPRPRTLVSGIKRLPGNSRLVYSKKGLSISTFPSPEYSRNIPVTDDIIVEYDSRVRRYLGRFQGVAPRYCISMSGGLDSRLLASAALREGWELEPFTIGEPGSLDAKMAGEMCKILGLSLKSHQVLGEKFGLWFSKAIWFTEGRVMAEHMHYISAQLSGSVPKGPQLHGLMGETVLGGHYDNAQLIGANADSCRQACRELATPLNYWPRHVKEMVFGKNSCKKMNEIQPVVVDELFQRMNFSGSYSEYLDFRFRFKAEAFANPGIIGQTLPWSDVINPFMDPDSYNFAAKLELDGIAERAGQLKWGLRYFPAIGKLPRVKAGVLIDVEDSDPQAYNRGVKSLQKKADLYFAICRLSRGRINLSINRSFPEYGRWYRRWESVRDFVDGVLLSEQTLDRGVFQREGLKTLLSDLRIGRNTWGAVSTCLFFEVFMRQFIDGTDRPSDPQTPFGINP